MTVWTKKWKKLLIWLSGYLSIIAFALVGGYTIVKSDDEDLQKTAKQAFLITAICTAVSALYSVIDYAFRVFQADLSYEFSSAWNSLYYFIALGKIVVFAVFIIIALVKKDKE